MNTLHPLFSAILSAHAALLSEAARAAGTLRGAAEALRHRDCPSTALMVDERGAALECAIEQGQCTLLSAVQQDSMQQEVA